MGSVRVYMHERVWQRHRQRNEPSTQIPQKNTHALSRVSVYVNMRVSKCLDSFPGEANIICTQPRRISAIGIAERVSSERAEKVGQTVGYQVCEQIHAAMKRSKRCAI